MDDPIAELLQHPEAALKLELPEAAATLARVEGLAAVLRARLAAPATNGNGDSRLLDAGQVAEMLGRSRREVYSMARSRSWEPFTVRVSPGKVRFRRSGLEQWLVERNGG